MKTKYSSEERDKQMMLHKHFSQTGEPALYISTYYKYNCGSLAGMWVSLASFSDYNEFMEFCRLLHWDEEDPELMYQDFEGFPEAWYSECGLNEKMFYRILEYGELSDEDKDIVDAYNNLSGEHDIDAARDAHVGEYDSEEDFAYELLEESDYYGMPENMRHYFNVSRFAEDLFDFDYYFENGHVFSRC